MEVEKDYTIKTNVLHLGHGTYAVGVGTVAEIPGIIFYDRRGVLSEPVLLKDANPEDVVFGMSFKNLETLETIMLKLEEVRVMLQKQGEA